MSFPGLFIHLWRSSLSTSFIFLNYVSMCVVWGSSSGFFGNEFFQLSCVWICLYFAVTFEKFLLSIQFCTDSFLPPSIFKALLYYILTCIISLKKKKKTFYFVLDKESACHCRRLRSCGFGPWVGKIPWRRKWQPTPEFLFGESHGQRSLAGYSPRSHKELDMMSKQHSHSLLTMFW